MAYRFACISASNVKTTCRSSTSLHTCELIAELLREQAPGQVDIDLISLGDTDLVSCCMDGHCYVSGECERDPAFNAIFARLKKADGIFLVCPHYAPFPSRLMMLMEKMEEIAYLNSCANPEYRFPLAGKPVALVGHGGQKETALPYYQKVILEPLANAFASLQMSIVSAGEAWPQGVAFGIQSVDCQTDSVFVHLEHDWPAIRSRLVPLVSALIQAVG